MFTIDKTSMYSLAVLVLTKSKNDVLLQQVLIVVLYKYHQLAAVPELETSDSPALNLTSFKYNLALLSSIPPRFKASAAINKTSAYRIAL